MDDKDLRDLKSVVYFWEEKGDVERCTSWARQRELLAQHYPEVLLAWQQLKMAERTMKAVVKDMSEKLDDIEDEKINDHFDRSEWPPSGTE